MFAKTAVVLAAALAAAVLPSPAGAQGTPRIGGVLKVASIGEPPTLEDVGSVKLGDYFTLDVARRDLRVEFRTGPRLYSGNTWLPR